MDRYYLALKKQSTVETQSPHINFVVIKIKSSLWFRRPEGTTDVT